MSLTWSVQIHHFPVFAPGYDRNTALDHQRYCRDCHDVLPHDLRFDDPCSGPYNDGYWGEGKEDLPPPQAYLIQEEP